MNYSNKIYIEHIHILKAVKMTNKNPLFLIKLNFFRLLVLIAFAGVIFCPSVAFAGVAAGLKLWVYNIIPSLFPALILTSCILTLFPARSGLSYLYIIIAGCVCGFPVGAFLCSQLYEKNHNRKICEAIMAYCNLSSPSFVINYIVLTCIGSAYSVWRSLLCIYLPVTEAVIFIFIRFRKDIFSFKTNSSITVSDNSVNNKISVHPSLNTVDILDHSIASSIRSILKLGGYIVVFSCLSAYIVLIPFGSRIITAIICGITEITNGIYLCSILSIDIRLKVLMIATVNAFGGISTIMQTAGITNGSHLGIKKYIYHKLAFSALTLLNAWLIVYVL